VAYASRTWQRLFDRPHATCSYTRPCSRPSRGGSPWPRCGERVPCSDAIATLEYMNLIGGHVCGGYLHPAVASPRFPPRPRPRTSRPDGPSSRTGMGLQSPSSSVSTGGSRYRREPNVKTHVELRFPRAIDTRTFSTARPYRSRPSCIGPCTHALATSTRS
jgi:hypothetical protein